MKEKHPTFFNLYDQTLLPDLNKAIIWDPIHPQNHFLGEVLVSQ